MASQQTNGIANDNVSEEFWQFLKPMLDEICNEPEVDQDEFASVAHKVYKHCNEGEMSYKLYENVQQYISNYVTTLLEVANGLPSEELLQYNGKQWERYHSCTKPMGNIFTRLNQRIWRHDKLRQFLSNKEDKEYYCVEELFNVTWKEQFHEPLLLCVTSVMHQSIEADRQGQFVEISDVSAVINSWTELETPFANMDEITDQLEGYMKSYTNTYIENMTALFKKRSMELLETGSFVEYMHEALKTINGEDKRIKHCLVDSVQISASNMCNQVWIVDHSETFLKEFQNFLCINNHEHLGVFHELVYRDLSVYEDCKEILQKHITSEFSNALLNGGKDASTDPKIYSELTLAVYSKYEHLIKNSFGGEGNCKSVLSMACGNFVNNDNGTGKAITSAKSSELLAKYCDAVLKTSKDQNDNELEGILNGIMLIFETMSNKDVFYTFYGKLLAKRLVQNASANYDIESYVITKLKEKCGDGATRKFQNMFQDIVLSKDLNKAYKKTLEADKATPKSDHAVQVLSTGSWPFEHSEQLSIFPEIECFISSFTDFYVGRHSGRKLNWLYHLSTGELVSTCFKQRYTIRASTFQVSILLRFNEATRYSIQQLHEDTGIRLDYLKPVVQLLVKSRLLVHEEDGELNSDSHIALFEGYKNIKSRVNINVPPKIEQKVEHDTTHYDIQRERRILIQAAIVRIMKARQKCYHDDLVVEIINELNSRFNPSITMIKKCIDDLIEKEYIDRKPNKINKYRYVA